MKIKSELIHELIREMGLIKLHLEKEEEKYKNILEGVSPTYQKSARNLIHYHALRHYDLRKIQNELRSLGMSRFNNSTGHVMASLLNSQQILHHLVGEVGERKKSGLSIKKGLKLLNNHTKEVLGYRSKNRRVRIMVTQPTEGADNYEMVHEMVKNGMNCARINCAHDGPEIWEAIIDNVRKAAHALSKHVTITMDLGGPKIRTGEITPGPRVRKFTPDRDDYGNVIKPAILVLVPKLNEHSKTDEIPVGEEGFSKISEGDKLALKDTRGKARTFRVVEIQDEKAILTCADSVYLKEGAVFEHLEYELVVEGIPPKVQAIPLRIGDTLEAKYGLEPGKLPSYNETGDVIQNAEIYCDYEELFIEIKEGDRVLFDDGKIEGKVVEKKANSFLIKITRAKLMGAKLKAEKGINVPDTLLEAGGLTKKDKEDLRFVAKHADVVNYSFVNRPHDVVMLIEELEMLGVKDKLNVILKIETQLAFDNLKEILLASMKTNYIGVMIARGDLAVETGWNKIGWVQREILNSCNAAHIPVIWATQVLESLAKKGLPSRSEITDAATSLKAECVMLNKGPYINEAIKLLDQILSEMEDYHEKNENMLPRRKKLTII